MMTQCTSTADAITGVLLAGDAVLNLSQKPLNTVAGTLFVTLNSGSLCLSTTPTVLQWQSAFAASLPALLLGDCSRLAIVSDASCDAAADVKQHLTELNLPFAHCILTEDCEADAFMDEEDAEAVAERLRQLGYL